MAELIEFVLLRNGEPILKGGASEMSAALGIPPKRVYDKERASKPDSNGYEVARALPDPPPWSPGTSPTLAALRKRRAEYDGWEPRYEL